MKLRRMRWAEHIAHTGEMRTAHRILVGKTKCKRPLGRRRLKQEDNIKMELVN
jgi:hypothetical protein